MVSSERLSEAVIFQRIYFGKLPIGCPVPSKPKYPGLKILYWVEICQESQNRYDAWWTPLDPAVSASISTFIPWTLPVRSQPRQGLYNAKQTQFRTFISNGIFVLFAKYWPMNSGHRKGGSFPTLGSGRMGNLDIGRRGGEQTSRLEIQGASLLRGCKQTPL